MNDDELQLTFLLHDLGIFFKRTGLPPSQKFNNLTEIENNRGGSHSRWSASLAEELGLSQDIQNVILYHHNHDSLEGENVRIVNVLSQAADFFAGEDELGPVNLLSVFSDVKLKESNHPEKCYLPLQKIDLAFEKPIRYGEVSNKEAYRKLWKDFLSELKKIGMDNRSENTYQLIKKYTTFLPSNSRDISLFDHIKVKTAIATCLYRCIQNENLASSQSLEKPFLLISGGISGIQRFIYRIASPAEAQVGMAKRLRGRSFYLNLLNDAVATSIRSRLNLPEANLLWCGGGNFLIIASNTDKTREEIEKFQKEVNKSLMQMFNAELFLNFTCEQAGVNELKDFSRLNEKLNQKLDKNKKQKFVENLDDLFAEDKENTLRTCSVCASPIKKNETLIEEKETETLCEDCNEHTEIGKKIAYAKYYIKSMSEKKSEKFDVFLFGVGYRFLRNENVARYIRSISGISKSAQVLKINDTDFVNAEMIKRCSESGIPVSFGFMFMANTVPKHEDKILSFTNMAELSRGADKLGILKMDVDNLGKIFFGGFDKKSTGIARISTMSTMLDFYFSGILNRICERHYFLDEAEICENCKKEAIKIELSPEEENEAPEIVYRMKDGKHACNSCLEKKSPAIYVNYAGGDDLLIIGPWDLIIQLAKDIRKTFKNFTCQNPDINISAGVSIINKKYPIGRAALLADEALQESKNNEKVINSHENKKDSISVFGETVYWETKEDLKGFYELLDFSNYLEGLIENKKISKGFVYSLLEIWNSSFGYGKILSNKVRREKKCYVPYLKYQLARNVRDRNVREDLDKKILKSFPWIKIPVSWVSLRAR
jgi:CRISPR-associated protein Csm1